MFPVKSLYKSFTISIAAGLIILTFRGNLNAQQTDRPVASASILSVINHSFEQGTLSPDEYILYQFQATFDFHKLPARFRPEEKGNMLIRCGTPPIAALYNHRQELLPSTLSKVETYTARPALAAEQTYLSPSGKFRLHYTTTGEDSVRTTDNDNNGIPDYVERTAQAADSSWNHMVDNLGYTDPITGPASPYHIYFRNFNFIYGRTVADGNTTYIEIHSTFENFPPNTDPEGDVIGSIKVTIAHELKHAIQFATNRWQGSAGSFGWIEIDGTLMEEVVYDNVNDYYNYIIDPSSIFLSPEESLPGAYWDMTWALYFEEQFGSNFWVQVWRDIGKNPNKNYLDAIKMELERNNHLFYRRFAESYLWHYASGNTYSAVNYGFEERLQYPDPTISLTIDGQIDSLDTSQVLAPLSANFIRIRPTGSENDQVLIVLNTDSTGLAAGALAYFKDGSVQSWFGTSSIDGRLLLETTWNWNEIDEIGLVATNTTQAGLVSYTISTASNQVEFARLEQNYPNPFNPGTTIRFTLLSTSNVTLQIYDLNGRLVRTLAEGEFASGPHEIRFEPTGLASGVYFYRLITDRKSLTKKMLLIK